MIPFFTWKIQYPHVKCLVTLGAGIWLLTCVDPFIFLKVNICCISHHFSPVWVLICVFKWAHWLNTLSQFWKGNWLFYLVDPYQMSCNIWSRHMAFHLCGSFHVYLECHWLIVLSCIFFYNTCFKCLVTFGAIKWTISFVGSFMFLQLFTFCFGPFLFFSSSCMGPFMCFKMGYLA